MGSSRVGFWAVLLTCLVVVGRRQYVRADFGVDSIVPDSALVAANNNLFRDSWNEVLAPIRRIPANLHSEVLQRTAAGITHLVGNVTEIGYHLAGNMTKAIAEKNGAGNSVFEKLDVPFGDMGEFLTNVAPVNVLKLTGQIGTSTADGFLTALNGLNQASAKTFKAMHNIEFAVNDFVKTLKSERLPPIANVPTVWSLDVVRALTGYRDEVRNFAKIVDISVRSIETANAYLEQIQFYARNMETVVQSSLTQFKAAMDSDLASVQNKYKTALKSYQTDFANAVLRLNVFNPNKTLLALKDRHTEQNTRSFYGLQQRSKTDTPIIDNAYKSIRQNMVDLVTEAKAQFLAIVDTTTSTIVSSDLAKGPFATQCHSKFTPRITGAFPTLQNAILSCVNRERSRIPRISEAIDRVLQLVQSNSVDFAADMGRCSRFTSFATNEVDFVQAKACLEANLNEANKYEQIVGRQLAGIRPILEIEIEASAFRSGQCVMQTVRELSTLMDSTRASVLLCSLDGP